MAKLKAPLPAVKLETLVAAINEDHVAFTKSTAEGLWSIGRKLMELRELVDKNELKWNEWCARLAIGPSMVSRYIQFATLYVKPPVQYKLEGPKGDPQKLRVLSLEEYIKAGQEAQKDGVEPMAKVAEMQEIKAAVAQVRDAKAKKAEVAKKLAKAKKELEDIPARTGPTREKQQRLVEELEAEAGELDPQVAAAEAELEQVERKRAKALEPQSFFDALALIGITFSRGKWMMEVPAAIAFGFIHNSGLPSGAMEKKVWEPYFIRLADVLKKTKASKQDVARFDACVAFFKEG